MNRIRSLFRKKTLRHDAVSGLVLGVESVPDGLASGLLAGVNPVYGLYGYLFGTFSGALATSSHFMAVQATGAMAIIVADVGLVHNGEDPERALFTLAVLTGVVMILAGLLKLGSWLRFVSHSVMVGFISAVGLNIVLGQLDNFTGYESQGSNRVVRAFDLLLHPFDVHLATLTVGVVAIVLILVLERSKLGALGMVVAVFLASGMVALFNWEVLLLSDIAEIPGGLPGISLPKLSYIPSLILPAASLAFVGLVQGAGISASFPNPDGEYPDDSQDFVGQGVGNIVAGLFQGMPVGGSMSASSLAVNGWR
jgi:SulP family sulfate permease